MADLGTDISSLPDLDFRIQSGYRNLAEAIARRLMTPRGGLFYDPTYGLDLRQYLNEAATDEVLYEIETLVAAECEKDPRILEAAVKASVTRPRTLTLNIELLTDSGPFKLVLAVNDVRVEVLYAETV